MKPFKKATQTLDDVSAASAQAAEAAEWIVAAMICVCCCSVVAMVLGAVALGRANAPL